MRFMEPLAQDLLKCMLAKAPVRTSDTSDELAKAKAKLAEHGIAMSPFKRESGSDAENPESDSKRAKPQMPIIDPEAQNDLLILKGSWIFAPRVPLTTMSMSG